LITITYLYYNPNLGIMAQPKLEPESFIPKLSVQDQLILELVSGKQKKAGYITFGGPELDSLYGIEYKKFDDYSLISSNGKKGKLPLPPEAIAQFESELKDRGLYHKRLDTLYQKFTSTDVPTKKEVNLELEHINYAISHNQDDLEKLVGASTDEEIGLALDYPSSDVKSYQKVINGVRRDAVYVAKAIQDALKKGIDIPDHYAYLLHVPEELDLIEGKVSEATEELLKKYQKHVREKNPALADIIEKDFTKKYLHIG
jgi:hypothetical protein